MIFCQIDGFDAYVGYVWG